MMKKLIQLVLLLLLTVPARGNNVWYISPTGSDSNPGTSSGAAFATFHHALAQMLGCDTLIVENGYYYDVMNMNTSNLAGNVGGTGCYTTIEAATTWGATIDSSQVTPTPNSTVFISEPYIQVIGIKAASNPNDTGTGGGGSPWAVSSTNHVKLQQTAGYNAPCGFNGVNWNVDVYAVGPSSSYVLIEDSHAWGCGRYKFLSYQSDHVIFRRDVARHDYAGGLTPTTVSSQAADFTTYDSQYTLLQNDIGIDSGLVNGETGNMYGSLWSEHNNGSIDNPIEMEGSIILNVQATGAIQDQKQSGAHTFINDAIWNSEGGLGVGAEITSSGLAGTAVTAVTLGASSATITLSNPTFVQTGNTIVFSGLTGAAAVLNGPTKYKVLAGANDVTPVSTFTVNYSSASSGGPYSTGGTFLWASGITLPTTNVSHMTIGNITGKAQDYSRMWGTDIEGDEAFDWYTSQSVTDSIFESANSFGAGDWVNSNNNYYYENTANFGTSFYQGYISTLGAEDVQGISPQIKYITREEPSTPVYGAASDGGNIGATILYEIGTTGTLFGDTGYDTLTTASLWPFPNEDVIKTDMASFTMANPIYGGTISGARGFAATATSLCGAPLSLTTYIWEALGYPTPSGVESGCSGYALSGIASPSSGGTVVPTSGSTCAQNYSSSGIAYSCTATPATGYTFASWSSCPGTATGNVCSGTMPSSSAIAQANFSSGATYTLTPATAGTGSGTMICSHSGSGIVSGTPYTCTATAASGSTLTSLVDGCGGTVSGNTTSGTVTGNCTITATFTAATTYMLSTSTAGTGSCTVAATSGSVCAGSYTSGTPYSCQAMAASGSSFASWSSTCGGTSAGTTYSGSMPSASCNVQATCTLIPGGPGSQWQGLGVQGQAGIW